MVQPLYKSKRTSKTSLKKRQQKSYQQQLAIDNTSANIQPTNYKEKINNSKITLNQIHIIRNVNIT